MRFLFSLILLLQSLYSAAAASSNLQELDYRIYPKRTQEEAAVLEWGHSAIISALDASVATFGPQTVDAALLEVECQPILASPLNGISKETSQAVDTLDNANAVHGNMVLMTNTGDLTGLEMAKIAVKSGAVALLVVNMDQDHPDDIYRLELSQEEEEEESDAAAAAAADSIDIPVCMISLNSANVLTTATVTPDMRKEDVVNNGMPDRVRLYAGGDRPFFEDVEPVDPTLYLIHNLMTNDECTTLIHEATKYGMDNEKDAMLLAQDSTKQDKIQKTVVWKGALSSYAGKQVEERMEQVTGFPSSHYSDFVVYKLSEKGAMWKPHYDILVNGQVPMATITVFLSNEDSSSPAIVYPSLNKDNDDNEKRAVKILPQQGMAIVHHNLDNENQQLDMHTLHAWLPSTSENEVYVAQKYVFATPPSIARRIVLPIMAAPFGGKLPNLIYKLHSKMVEKFGMESGNVYFDKLCVFVPLLMFLCAAQAIANYIQTSMKSSKKTKQE